MQFLKTSLRAVFAALATFGAGLYTAAIENGGSLSGFADATWIGLGVATLTAYGGVWGFVNVKA
jgi:hypothetical protein